MKVKTVVVATAVVALALLLTGCPWPDGSPEPESQVGRLRINLPSQDEARTITEGLAMDVGTWEITLSGPGGAVASESLDGAATTTTFANLVVGEWSINVDALNASTPPLTIARDTATATIQAGQVATVSMTVLPLAGEGSLTLTLSWPDGVVASPGIAATITPQGEVTGTEIGTLFSIDTTTDPDVDIATYSGNFASGYHTLSIAITDGNATVWPASVESVWIADQQNTQGTWVITIDEMDPVAEGSLEVDVDADLQNPYTITFDATPATIDPAVGTTITATLDPDVAPDSYEWYLNGVLQDTYTGNTITLGGAGGVALADGTAYRLSLLVTHAPILSSESFAFRAQAAAP